MNFLNRLIWKLKHMNGAMDWLWLIILLYNVYSVFIAIARGDILSIVISSVFIYLGLYGLIKN